MDDCFLFFSNGTMLCPKVYRQRKKHPKKFTNFLGCVSEFFCFFIEKIQLIRISLEKADFSDFCKKVNHPKFLDFRWFFVVAGVGSSAPVKNIVAFFGARCCTLSARIFHLLRLAFSATGGARLRSPRPPGYEMFL